MAVARRLVVFILIAVTAAVAQCPTCNRDWRVRKNPDPFLKAWDYVCVPTGRVDDAGITFERDGLYHVWSRGGGYGEFETLQQAKHQSEQVVIDRKISCP